MNKMKSRLLVICSILGALAVGLGAFGAHGLKNALPSEKMAIYSTGVMYHFYHTITLLGVILFSYLKDSKWFFRASICFIVGIILFSGSLYLLATRELLGMDNYKWLGPLTPIGGVFFICGWICIGVSTTDKNGTNAAK